MNEILIDFKDAKAYIQEADILLFRGKGWISKIIGTAGCGVHSHVAMASWHNGDNALLECVEFYEKAGGRTINLETLNNNDDRMIDVYRVVDQKQVITFDPNDSSITHRTVDLDRKKVTNNLRKLTGLPYGWRRLLWIAKAKMVGFRLFFDYQDLINDDIVDVVYPVCSSALAYSFSQTGFDLVPNKGDGWTEPADIARSGLINYLFTLNK
jgi:hypothetical protein